MLYQLFIKTLHSISGREFCLALSGGLDSIVLLHLFQRLRQEHSDVGLRAIHAHHGLNANAQDWASFCQQGCDDYEIPLTISYLQINKSPGDSLEELARRQRYQCFKQQLNSNEILVTAHHQDDQAETVLLQLLRGAGVRGLSAMVPLKAFADGFLFRPLLAIPRSLLHSYAQAQNLTWIEDGSNQDLSFDRNFLRQKIFPLLKERWPSLSVTLARSAYHCSQTDKLIGQQVAEQFKSVYDSASKTLNLINFQKLPRLLQPYIIRYWLQNLNLRMPSTKKLTVLLTDIVTAKPDAEPLLRWHGVEVRRYQQHLYALAPLQSHNAQIVISWDLQQDLCLPNEVGVVTLDSLKKMGLEYGNFKNASIRFRQGGEHCRLPNRLHHHSLKKLFQSWQIPPWQRDRVPLLYEGDDLKAIIGYTVCNQN